MSPSLFRSAIRFRPSFQLLEDRSTPAALVVNALTDTGTGSGDAGDLRYCINEANARTGVDTITFDPAVFSSPTTIALTSGTQLLLNDSSGSTIITGPSGGVTITGNNVTRVLQVAGSTTVNLTRLTITGGRISGMGAAGSGGGIYKLGLLSLTDCRVDENFASQLGSGIFNHYAEAALNLTNCSVSGNTGAGGGIYTRYGTVVATGCTISGNSGSGVTNAGSVTLTDCTVAGNLSGGIFNNGTLVLRNCTVTGNSGTDAGGLSNRYGTATLTNCTVTDNISSRGGIYDLGTTTLKNVIVVGNRDTFGNPADLTGSVDFLGSNNLIGPGGDGGFVNGTAGNIVLNVGDFVGLGTLGDFGGRVQTIPLLPGSPALNRGSPSGVPTSDARGKGRVGAVDIGAFESQGYSIAIVGGDHQLAIINTPFANPLEVEVTANDPVETVDGGSIVFTPPSSGASATIVGSPATVTAGRASVTATALGIAGAFGVSATGIGVTSPVTFNLTAGLPPGITSPASATFQVGFAGSFPITVTGTPNATVTVVGTLPNGIAFDPLTKRLSGTPTQSGTFAVRVVASNGLNPDADQDLTITVNLAPTITSAASTTFRINTPGSFSITAIGFPAPSVTLAGTLPNGLTYDTSSGVLSGTPTEFGIFSVSVSATNGVTPAASQTLTIVVGLPPAITSAAIATFRVGSSAAFAVTTTGFPNASVSAIGTLPSGVTFNPATKSLSGTPTQPGVYSITFVATNGVNPPASQAFVLTVFQAPSIASPAMATFVLGAFASHSVTAIGFPTPSLTATGPLPSGVSFVDNGNGTGTLLGTPTRPGRFSISIAAANGIEPDAFQTLLLVVPAIDQNAVSRYATTGGSDGGGEVRGPDSAAVAALPATGSGLSRAAVADVTGDGIPDTILVPGPGFRVVVTVVDGRTGAVVATLPAFVENFRGGAFVSAADITGDFRADIVVSADTTGSARVTVFDGALGDIIADFFGIDDPNFRGGARVALGDVNGDRTPDDRRSRYGRRPANRRVRRSNRTGAARVRTSHPTGTRLLCLRGDSAKWRLRGFRRREWRRLLGLDLRRWPRRFAPRSRRRRPRTLPRWQRDAARCTRRRTAHDSEFLRRHAPLHARRSGDCERPRRRCPGRHRHGRADGYRFHRTRLSRIRPHRIETAAVDLDRSSSRSPDRRLRGVTRAKCTATVDATSLGRV